MNFIRRMFCKHNWFFVREWTEWKQDTHNELHIYVCTTCGAQKRDVVATVKTFAEVDKQISTIKNMNKL
jgi:hypothetical protein